MEKINSKFYDGFEGEPEIQFICENADNINRLIIWEGYFDEIMRSIKSTDTRRTDLAYYYHMYTGWYDESPWKIVEPEKALSQFESIDRALLKIETAQVLEEI